MTVTAPRRTHSDLKRAVMRACNLLPGVFLFPVSSGAFAGTYNGKARYIRMGMKGASDLVGWKTHDYPHRLGPQAIFVAFEVKIGKDRLTPEQAAFLERVRLAGGIAREIRSVDDAVKALR